MTGLSTPGALVAAIAAAMGARVTSGLRDAEENARVGGSPISLHLTGDAIDLSGDAPPLAIAALRLIADVRWHEKGTAPHWHVEVRPWTVAVVLGGIVGLVAFVSRKEPSK